MKNGPQPWKVKIEAPKERSPLAVWLHSAHSSLPLPDCYICRIMLPVVPRRAGYQMQTSHALAQTRPHHFLVVHQIKCFAAASPPPTHPRPNRSFHTNSLTGHSPAPHLFCLAAAQLGSHLCASFGAKPTFKHVTALH